MGMVRASQQRLRVEARLGPTGERRRCSGAGAAHVMMPGFRDRRPGNHDGHCGSRDDFRQHCSSPFLWCAALSDDGRMGGRSRESAA
jgi:hypothetical protein